MLSAGNACLPAGNPTKVPLLHPPSYQHPCVPAPVRLALQWRLEGQALRTGQNGARACFALMTLHLVLTAGPSRHIV